MATAHPPAVWYLRTAAAETDVRNSAHKSADRTGRTQMIVFLDGSGRKVEFVEPDEGSPWIGDGAESARRIRENLRQAVAE